MENVYIAGLIFPPTYVGNVFYLLFGAKQKCGGPNQQPCGPPTRQNMTQNMWAHPVRANRGGKGYWEGYWEADWACLVPRYLFFQQ